MPTAWKLLASNDKENWRLLDNQKNFTNWSANNFQTFSLRQQQPARYYRFVFEKALHPEIMRIYEIKLN